VKNTYAEIMNNREKKLEYTEYRIITLSGIEKTIAWHNAIIKNKDSITTGLLSSGEDITERKKAEEALREREELLNRSQEMASLGGFIWGRHDNSLTWSKNMYAIHGLNEGSVTGDLGELSIQMIHPDDLDRVAKEIAQMLKETDTWDVEFRIVRPDGIERIIRSSGKQEYDAKGAPGKCFGIYQDITEQKEAEKRLKESEEKLLRSRKMETLGLLAGGVAHDLNNVLSGIVSYPELLLFDLPENSKLRKPIQTIHDSGKRAVAIVNDLLTIARGVATPKETLCLNDIIDDYLTSPEFKKLTQYHPDVEVMRDREKELLNINGSTIHIRKVIMNLVSNAAEAIEKRGRIIISTMNR
jgi:PAS domain S-box-containing protein